MDISALTLFLIFYNYKQSLKYIKRKLIRPIYYQRGILHYEFFFCNLTFIFTVKCDILQDITSFIFCSVFIYFTNETTRVHYISIVSCLLFWFVSEIQRNITCRNIGTFFYYAWFMFQTGDYNIFFNLLKLCRHKIFTALNQVFNSKSL